jgi:hypothetical protein
MEKEKARGNRRRKRKLEKRKARMPMTNYYAETDSDCRTMVRRGKKEMTFCCCFQLFSLLLLFKVNRKKTRRFLLHVDLRKHYIELY